MQTDPDDEWLVHNGLGGYASGTVSGAPTRRFHGLLVSAMAEGKGRMMVLNAVSAWVQLPDGSQYLLDPAAWGYGGAPLVHDSQPPLQRPLPQPAELCGFDLVQGLPVWRFRAGQVMIERR